MSWVSGQRSVADPSGASVSGAAIAGGAQVQIDITFRVREWPWEEKGPLSLVPQPSSVTARVARGELGLGFALPSPATLVTPASHSSTSSIRYTLFLTTSAIAELETARDGGPLELVMTLVAHSYVIAQHEAHPPGIRAEPSVDTFLVLVPKEQWLGVLATAGYCETLLTELRLPSSGPESTAKGRQRLVQAVQARNDGSYAEAMRRCRIALDELKMAGFAGKAPDEVARLLQDRAGSMSQPERFSALRIALQLFLAPTHHANAPEEYYTREDAEFAIAITAALLRLAPQWGTEPPEGE